MRKRFLAVAFYQNLIYYAVLSIWIREVPKNWIRCDHSGETIPGTFLSTFIYRGPALEFDAHDVKLTI